MHRLVCKLKIMPQGYNTSMIIHDSKNCNLRYHSSTRISLLTMQRQSPKLSSLQTEFLGRVNYMSILNKMDYSEDKFLQTKVYSNPNSIKIGVFTSSHYYKTERFLQLIKNIQVFTHNCQTNKTLLAL